MDAKTLGHEPINFISNSDDRTSPDTDGWGCRGLTKRELFAAMAMSNKVGISDHAQSTAKIAVIYADALLAELAKEQP